MNIYLVFVLTSFIIVSLFEYGLEYLNISSLKKNGAIIPPEFEGYIDRDLLVKTGDYTIEKTRFGIVSSLISSIAVLVFLFGGLLDIYNSWVVLLKLPFVVSGLVFFLLLSLASSIFSIPFSLYRTFRIEKKYGFNSMTIGTWLGDLIKSFLISTILSAVLISGGLWLVQRGALWWLWVWMLFLLFSVFLMYLSPYIIEPLFNKFTPVEDQALAEGIRNLMQKVGLKAGRVFSMDASRRTRHTNAYFTGIGKVKRIVLYDTLLSKLENTEIFAVLAHEIGHWKKKHLLKHMIVLEGVSLAALYFASRLLKGDILSRLFQITDDTFFAKVLVLLFLVSIVSFPLGPLANYFSRKHEKEADRFSVELAGDAEGMIRALVKLSKDNLSNLHPHPLYALFHYSHPPVTERIKYIRQTVYNKEARENR